MVHRTWDFLFFFVVLLFFANECSEFFTSMSMPKSSIVLISIIKGNAFTIVLFSAVVLILLQQTACEQSVEVQPVPEEISEGILPLRVGYYWEYITYVLREDSSVGLEFSRASYKVIRTSYHPSRINRDLLFHWVFINPYDNNQSQFEWFFRNYDDGLYLMGGRMPTDSISTQILELKYPVKKGESWKTPHLVYNLLERKYMIPDTITYTCVDTNAIFETPLGKFSCVVYYHREKLDEDVLGKADIYEYYSKEVGAVGSITNSYFDYNQKSYPSFKRVLVKTNVITNEQ